MAELTFVRNLILVNKISRSTVKYLISKVLYKLGLQMIE